MNKIGKILFFLSVPFLTGFFCCHCLADEKENIIINELLPDPKGDEKTDEFIELYNPTEKDIDLTSWILKDKTTSKYVFPAGVKIKSKNYLTVYSSDYSFSLNNSGDEEVFLLDASGEIIFTIAYKNATGKNSYSRDGDIWKWSDFITPDEKNKFVTDSKPADPPVILDPLAPKEYSSEIYLNEILPNPAGDEGKDEFVEIFNPTEKDVDLAGWILKDKTSSKYVFPAGAKIKSKNYLAVYSSDYSFALNNTEEEIFLLNPEEKIVSQIAFSDAPEGMSFSKNGSVWQWTKYLTLLSENKFPPKGQFEISIPEAVFKNVYAEFFVKDKNKKDLKVTWDFGDGHKSYLIKTKHKYEKSGSYNLSVKISDGENSEKEFFTITVGKFSGAKVEIVTIAPNPAGKDTKKEWLEIRNNSGKKINLKNWSVATGSKNLYNHPVNDDFEIGVGKTKKLTRKNCAFTLANKKGKIELRAPDGEVVQKIKYDHGKESIADDEVYQKNGKKWEWVGGKKTDKKKKNTKTNAEEDDVAQENIPEEIVVPEVDPEEKARQELEKQAQENLGKISVSDFLETKKKNKIALLQNGTNMKLPENFYVNAGRVLGAESVREFEGTYHFSEISQEKHWAKILWQEANGKVNQITSKVWGWL